MNSLVTVEHPLTTAGIYITRRCNLACAHCSVRKAISYSEMSSDQWKEAFRIMRSISIEKVSVLGGEPTVYEGIAELVRFNSEVTGMDLSIVSNSMADIEILESIVRAGLRRYSTSIDTITLVGFDRCSTAKSHRALQVLLQMKEWGVPYLTGYLVLRKENANEVEGIARLLTGNGIWLYLLPFHASPGNHWQTRERNGQPAFRSEDRGFLTDFSKKIIELKSQGILFANTIEYLESLPEYAVNLDWHCAPAISELRIDADGVLMSCNDIRGPNLSTFSVFSLAQPENIPLVFEARQKDTEGCSGCYWPSHFHAEQLRLGKTNEGWIWQNDQG